MPRCIRWNWLWQWYWALQALNWHFALLFKELTTYWAKITLCCHCILETKRKHQSWLANSLQIIMIEFGWHKKYKKSLKRVCSKNKKITKSLKFCSSEILDAFQQNIVFGVHALFLLEWYYLRVPGKVWRGGGGVPTLYEPYRRVQPRRVRFWAVLVWKQV